MSLPGAENGQKITRIVKATGYCYCARLILGHALTGGQTVSTADLADRTPSSPMENPSSRASSKLA